MVAPYFSANSTNWGLVVESADDDELDAVVLDVVLGHRSVPIALDRHERGLVALDRLLVEGLALQNEARVDTV